MAQTLSRFSTSDANCSDTVMPRNGPVLTGEMLLELKQAGSTPVPCTERIFFCLYSAPLTLHSSALDEPTIATTCSESTSLRAACWACCGSTLSSSTRYSSLRPPMPPSALTLSNTALTACDASGKTTGPEMELMAPTLIGAVPEFAFVSLQPGSANSTRPETSTAAAGLCLIMGFPSFMAGCGLHHKVKGTFVTCKKNFRHTSKWLRQSSRLPVLVTWAAPPRALPSGRRRWPYLSAGTCFRPEPRRSPAVGSSVAR